MKSSIWISLGLSQLLRYLSTWNSLWLDTMKHWGSLCPASFSSWPKTVGQSGFLPIKLSCAWERATEVRGKRNWSMLLQLFCSYFFFLFHCYACMYVHMLACVWTRVHYLTHWGDVSQLNSELVGKTSLVSKLALEIPFLCLPRV